LEEAEKHYTAALSSCYEIARSNITDRALYSRYRLAVTITALARLFLDRGELARALRECYAAKTLLLTSDPSSDLLTTSYVDYLIGSILRQQGKNLPMAVMLLSGSLAVFAREGHSSHYLRCRHELAKAYLNQGVVD
jgi:hypothetical protein